MRFWEQATGSGADSKEPEGGTYEQLKMTLTGVNTSSKKFQESATAMLKNMTPLLQKCRSMSFRKMLMPSVAVNRSSQQTELIKWQQEMFHRILNMMCLVEEGLTEQAELDSFRADLLRTLTTAHPNGEWADFTRDKLLFLQDLFQSKCISEEDYHKAKRPILSRLADQGAELDTQDFKFNSKEIRPTGAVGSSSKAETNPARDLPEALEVELLPCDVTTDSGSAKKTPIKHVMDAMARLKSVGSGGKTAPGSASSEEKPRVPHALDFVRRDPRECPTREAPIAEKKPQEVPINSPLYFDASTGSTYDLLPELSNNQSQDVEKPQSPASVPSSPTIASLLSPPSVSSATLTEQSKSLLKPPKKLTFTPTKSSLTAKTTLGFARSQSTRVDNSSSPLCKTERSLSRKFTGIFGKWQGWQTAEDKKQDSDCDDDADSEDERERRPKKTSVWKKLDLLRPVSKKQQQDDENDDDFGKEISDKDPLLKAINNYPSDKIKDGYIHGQGPNIKKLKKKVAVRTAPTNFFIDQVLGDNIKTELVRIRAEMTRSNPAEQAFTNDQIEAIATRLPVDKTELMRFFPKSWCDRYGDIVLEVVHKEFNSHVSEMDGSRKTGKDKKATGVKGPVSENDENKSSEFQTRNEKPPSTKSFPSTPQSKTPSKPLLSKCYTTDGKEMKSASVHRQQESSPMTTPGGRARRGLGFENDLDVKLGAEILRMPFKNFNDAANVRS